MLAAAEVLPRIADCPAAGVGMHRDLHHLGDETGPAHCADLASPAGNVMDRRSSGAARRSSRILRPNELRALNEDDLRACRLGFRREEPAAHRAVDCERHGRSRGDQPRCRMRKRTPSSARLPGVGAKVANCVLLFGLERLRAFPIDVWIERVLRRIYFPRKRTVTIRQLQDFSRTYFGAFSGYAQQYLFHHARMTRKRERPDEYRCRPEPRGDRPTAATGSFADDLHRLRHSPRDFLDDHRPRPRREGNPPRAHHRRGARVARGIPAGAPCGERQGERIDGFDLGNSPFEYQQLRRGKSSPRPPTARSPCARANTVRACSSAPYSTSVH